MALKKEDKPMLPATELPVGHVQCADDAQCRKPGRMWIEGMPAKARVCIEHFYVRLESRRTAA